MNDHTPDMMARIVAAMAGDKRTVEALSILERAEGDAAAEREAAALFAAVALPPFAAAGLRAPDKDEQRLIDAIRQIRVPLDENPATIAAALAPAIYWNLRTATRMAAEPTPLEPTPAVTGWGALPPPPAREWIVKGWIPAGRISMLTGEGGRGKSRLALMLAAELARDGSRDPAAPEGGGRWMPGGPELGTTDPAPVVFASWEDERDEILRRLHDWPGVDATGDVRNGLRDRLGDGETGRLAYLDMSERGPIWGPTGTGHTSNLGAITATGTQLRDECERRGAKLLIVDPLAAAYACNENDRALVRGFLADWNGWAARAGCAVLVIAHPPKSEAGYSGSTDWRNGVRALLTLDHEGERDRLRADKMSYAKRPPALALSGWTWWRAAPWEDGDYAPGIA